MSEASQSTRIGFYADPQCPYAYLTAYRLRQVLPEFGGQIEIVPRCLSLEYINREPTPKRVIAGEAPLVLLSEPEIPFQPWHAPESEWPVTMWPAFEAVKCAERQGIALANDLDWAIRRAFYAESRCISLRHVILTLAAGVGLDLPRFTEDFDAGVCKRQVLTESQEGWEELKLPGSPTLVLPTGRVVSGSDLGLPEVELDLDQNARLTAFKPSPYSRDQCLRLLREILEEGMGS